MSIASGGTPYVASLGPARLIDAWITAKVRRSICGATSAAQRSETIAFRSSTASPNPGAPWHRASRPLAPIPVSPHPRGPYGAMILSGGPIGQEKVKPEAWPGHRQAETGAGALAVEPSGTQTRAAVRGDRRAP